MIVIALVIVLNGALSYAQEAKTDGAVAALADVTNATCSVLRDGQLLATASADLVAGELQHRKVLTMVSVRSIAVAIRTCSASRNASMHTDTPCTCRGLSSIHRGTAASSLESYACASSPPPTIAAPLQPPAARVRMACRPARGLDPVCRPHIPEPGDRFHPYCANLRSPGLKPARSCSLADSQRVRTI